MLGNWLQQGKDLPERSGCRPIHGRSPASVPQQLSATYDVQFLEPCDKASSVERIKILGRLLNSVQSLPFEVSVRPKSDEETIVTASNKP